MHTLTTRAASLGFIKHSKYLSATGNRIWSFEVDANVVARVKIDAGTPK
jgi:hypothetical protein